MTHPESSASPIVVPGFSYGDGSVEPAGINEAGLTKREYFAALALQGILAGSPQSVVHGLPYYADHQKQVCDIAAGMADSLIEALNRPKES